MSAWRPQTKSKYGAAKVDRDGYTFASQLEAATYDLLKLRLLAGEFDTIQCQVTVYLTDARIRYIPDFKCSSITNHTSFFVESKGYIGERWPTIKKLWLYYGEAPLEIYTGHYSRPTLTETIIPRSKK